ncbi:MAG: hypothetical protein HPY60_07765 [Candidatus Methanofastidiosum sp.]|nr:hypothetical protein [Methanofastidiosum sp.]
MATNDEFDREIREATRRYVRGEVSKDEFESLKKEIVSRHLKRAYQKDIESRKKTPNKLSRGNKGLLLLLILLILSLSTYAIVTNVLYVAPLDTTASEEETIFEKIISIPKAIIENDPATTIEPIDKAIIDDKSRHIFTQGEASTVPAKILATLPFSLMRSMTIDNFSLDGAEGVVDLSVVKEGYVIYPSKTTGGAEVYITLFLVEYGKHNKFFREISTYVGSFDSLRRGYTRGGDGVSTELSSIQYDYALTENSNRYPVRAISFKSSNIVGFIYYLDPKGEFSLQSQIEGSVKSVLKSYE